MAVMGVCPDCGYKFPLHLALADARARKALVAALEVQPSLATRIIYYLDLFSPAKRALRMDRLANLLDEIATDIKAAQIKRDGCTYAAPLEYWKTAFDELLAKRDTLTLPLKSHGYLYTIIAGMAQKAGYRKEERKEHVARSRTHTDKTELPKKASDIIDKAAQKESYARGANQAKEILSKAGKTSD